MSAKFKPVVWDDDLVRDCRELVRLALREDLADVGDLTSLAVVSAERRGRAEVVSRAAGVIAGGRIASVVLEEAKADAGWWLSLDDGDPLEPGTVVGRLEGNARDLLRCERLILNLLNRLSGVATLTQAYVEAAGEGAAVYDTRKTTPGWRRLEKFAVRCGGGHNHRTGLFDAVMIKDNHLALADREGMTPADAVWRAREASDASTRIVEVEVDTLEQLRGVLLAKPDVVLLDNMPCDTLRQAVAIRNELAPAVVLEASGGVRLDTIGAIAQTGVERVSVGALTHSAIGLDLGLDWS